MDRASRIATIARRVATTVAILATFACQDDSPVRWDAEKRVSGIIAPGAQLVLSESGVPALTQGWKPIKWPEDSTACAGSQVGARARGDTAFAVWVHVNSYGYGDVMLARTDDGLKWNKAELLGGVVGKERVCSRPPVAIAVDSTTGAVFVAWHGMSQWGPGLLFMQAPAAGRQAFAVRIDSLELEHAASIAARSDTVAVAYEWPTPAGTEVRLAISMEQGHIPQARGTVSPSGSRAFAPVVALGGGRVAVAWNEGRRGDAPPAAAARVGKILR